jgi:hypothetical protein
LHRLATPPLKGGETYLIEFLLIIIINLKLILKIGSREDPLPWRRVPIEIGIEEASLNSQLNPHLNIK